MNQTIDLKAIGQRVKRLRKDSSLTQAQAAKQCGVSTSFLGHVERGTCIASLETMAKIAAVLDVSLDGLIYGTGASLRDSSSAASKARILNDIMRVLDQHSSDWLKIQD